jgi:hypothetical protein
MRNVHAHTNEGKDAEDRESKSSRCDAPPLAETQNLYQRTCTAVQPQAHDLKSFHWNCVYFIQDAACLPLRGNILNQAELKNSSNVIFKQAEFMEFVFNKLFRLFFQAHFCAWVGLAIPCRIRSLKPFAGRKKRTWCSSLAGSKWDHKQLVCTVFSRSSLGKTIGLRSSMVFL